MGQNVASTRSKLPSVVGTGVGCALRDRPPQVLEGWTHERSPDCCSPQGLLGRETRPCHLDVEDTWVDVHYVTVTVFYCVTCGHKIMCPARTVCTFHTCGKGRDSVSWDSRWRPGGGGGRTGHAVSRWLWAGLSCCESSRVGGGSVCRSTFFELSSTHSGT